MTPSLPDVNSWLILNTYLPHTQLFVFTPPVTDVHETAIVKMIAGNSLLN